MKNIQLPMMYNIKIAFYKFNYILIINENNDSKN